MLVLSGAMCDGVADLSSDWIKINAVLPTVNDRGNVSPPCFEGYM
ncbi:hypothetical protein FHT85_006092 [Rhizobium sp. BK312]|nr:hypothetical protein [Rhizobium sp. BK312]MBB3429061.1 hypothetical protein [Rhizobium sp. BK312]